MTHWGPLPAGLGETQVQRGDVKDGMGDGMTSWDHVEWSLRGAGVLDPVLWVWGQDQSLHFFSKSDLSEPESDEGKDRIFTPK